MHGLIAQWKVEESVEMLLGSDLVYVLATQLAVGLEYQKLRLAMAMVMEAKLVGP